MATAVFPFSEGASWRDLFSDVFCIQGTIDHESALDGVGESISIGVPGLRLGDMCIGIPSFGVSTLGMLVTANVTTSGVKAVTTLTSTGALGNTETVTINGQVYTFLTTLTNTVPNEVLIGANQTASHLNLLRAVSGVTGASIEGTCYSYGTQRNSAVTGTSSDGTHTIFKAREVGVWGNGIATTETCANASFTSTVMASGADPVLMLRIQNESASTRDLASTTFRVLIGRPNSNLFRGTNY